MSTLVATAMVAADAPRAALSDALAVKLAGRAPVLVMAFASVSHARPLDVVIDALRARFPGAVVVGASTSGELIESGDAERSVSAAAICGAFEAHAMLGRDLRADADGCIDGLLSALPTVGKYPHRTAFMLLDPLSGVSEEATLAAAVRLGPEVQLAGGAAGDDLRMKQTYVACGGEVASDAAVIVMLFSAKPLGVGVVHGHSALPGPRITVTRAQGNVVYELDGRPAWEVWVERTTPVALIHGLDPRELVDADIGAYLLRYEAALETGTALKVRAPLSRGADGSLAFACGIPVGAEICITESSAARQVESARRSARDAKRKLAGAPPAGAIVFDCICRKVILGSSFGDAIRAISEELGGAPLAGFQTYGEVALECGDMSGFHNTTTVVVAFPG
jgi:methyl-accepting chemotaxis protein